MSDLTQVEVLWLEKRIENRVRFGRIAEEQKIDRSRRILSFTPGSIFAFVRWTSNDWNRHLTYRCLARGRTGTALLDRALCEAGGGEFAAAGRLAKGRTGAAGDRRH
ncbi:hypothetical protein ABIB81_008049 [Bradyrhizobium sp. I1.7.5]